ncbi:hypothetical protein [Microvirga aerophila]|uniref:Uncharacterized protein n=1 Tax=Microvirga aerophila TaxID=670291 RepID=A0A512C4X3_9HYPH|nr:hypothetical protein [Microvirga aerophila]GEO19248.1 hypothetical protein MAE02_69440 [Microvirga aerophila]
MPQSKTTAWSILPDQKAVDQTIHRLIQGGFPRATIKTSPRADKRYDVHVDTTPDRLREVERLIHASAPLYALRETTKGVGATMASKPLLSVGAVALAGYALYSLFTRGRQGAVQSLTELPRTIRDLPVDQWADNVADAAEQVADTVRSTVQSMSEKGINLGDQSGGAASGSASGPASTTGTSAASSSITPTSPTGVTKPPQTTGATPQTTDQPNEQKTGQNK